MVRDNSLCGSKITAVTAGGQRSSATIGGLILIETEQGDFQTLGMTASHFLTPNHNIEAAEEDGREEDGEEGEVDNDSDEGSFDDEQEYELDLSLSGSANLTRNFELTHRHELPKNTGSIIGRIFRTSQDSRQDELNLDWALFTIENGSLYLLNIVAAREVTRAIHPKAMETERGVVLSTATSGLLYGKLSNSSSHLMLAPGNGMVKTHSLKIFNKQKLTAGDSGAWVVDILTNELYGHVIASDVFGTAYVVPIHDIFKAIKIQLSLQATIPPNSQFSCPGPPPPLSTNDTRDSGYDSSADI